VKSPSTNTLFISLEAWAVIRDHVSYLRGIEVHDFPVMIGVEEVSEDDFPVEINFHRFLDRYWTVYVWDDVAGKISTERMMFEFIAKDYEFEIEMDRNVDCFQILLGLASVRPGNLILDFGCGPGLSYPQLDDIEVIGCDVSPSMVQLARSRGINAIDPIALSNLVEFFDAALASYVMHLSVPIEDIGCVVRSLRIGGRFAANFHKGWGLSEFEEGIQSFRAMSQRSELNLNHEVHGAIRVWERIY
jgi:SAM-dependent methyltransferase